MASFHFTHPETFNFTKPETWEKWFKRFERFKLASGLSEKAEDVQINTLVYSMGPQADDILSSFSLSAADKKKWKPVTERFTKYFIPKRNIIFERAKFNQRKQDAGETVDSFVTELHVLAENCHFGALHDEMIRDRVVVGLSNPKVSEKLQLDAELTLEKAITQARQSEAVKQQQTIVRGAPNEANTDAVRSTKFNKSKLKTKWTPPKTFPQGKTPQGKNGCKRCGNRFAHTRDKCPAKEAKCFKCSRIGHFSKCCLSKTSLGMVETDNDAAFLGTVNGSNEERPWTTRVKIQNVDFKFKIDTGADVTVLSDQDFAKLQGIKLSKSTRSLYGPGNIKLHVLGKFTSDLETNNAISVEDVYVMKGLKQSLLGRPALQALKVIEQVNISSVKAPDSGMKSESYYRAKFPNVFNGLGKTNWEYKITLSSSAQPYALSVPRRVPIPLLGKVKNELERMEKLGVISKVDEPTEWCAGMVVVPKPNGKVRICVDLTKLNKSVKRENHPLPTVEDSLAQLAGARIFSKLDANSGFWQVNLDKESRHLTTFITPFGRFAFNRLPFGISSAPEFFQKRMSEMLVDLPGVLCRTDDVLIYGQTQEEHDKRLENVLHAIAKAGVTLNEKCEFSKPFVTFLGHVIGSDGCKVDPEKVKAISEMETPQNVSDVRRFLGMVNQLSKFSQNLAEKTNPIRELLKAKNAWSWGPAQEKAFADIKHDLISTPTLGHYDPNKDIIVSADASSFGIGAVMRQKQGQNLLPVAFASRSMSETEQRYAQIEKEVLAITWACERFSNYLIGTHFTVETDHKPLVPLLSTKDLAELPPRIQRFKMRLMRFSFSINHIAGKDLITADALSRAPVDHSSSSDLDFQNETDAYVNYVMSTLPATKNRLEQIKIESQKDSVCKNLLQYCKTGWPEKSALDDIMKPYWSNRGDFTVHDDLLLKGTRIVIPKPLQTEILEKIHEGHQGIVKCRERAKTSVWWLGLSTELENVVKSCQKCIEHTNYHSEPLMPTEFPKRPWQRVGSDLFDLKGQTYLLVVDYHSRYIEIAKLLGGTSSNSVINHLKSIFARHGIPETFVSDNGPQYSSLTFREFALKYGFQHVTSSPRYPQSNGMAERAVQTIKGAFKKADDPYLALLAYRATPLQNGFSPAELLMGRKLQTSLPVTPTLLDPKWPNLKRLTKSENVSKQKQKRNFDKKHNVQDFQKLENNDQVWIKDYKTKGVVQSQYHTPRSYIVKTDEGEIRRNRKHLVLIPTSKMLENPKASETIPVHKGFSEKVHGTCESQKEFQPVIKDEGYITRSGRISKPSHRLDL